MMDRSGSFECDIWHFWGFGIEGLGEREKVHFGIGVLVD